jgi:sugar phosphate isomerase/epimerase
MGADPLAATRALAPAIYHVHAKDTRIDRTNAPINSLIDTNPTERLLDRAWNYVTLGYGHDQLWWREFCSQLGLVGYDDVLSIEHEDQALPPLEGVRRSVELLRSAI